MSDGIVLRNEKSWALEKRIPFKEPLACSGHPRKTSSSPAHLLSSSGFRKKRSVFLRIRRRKNTASRAMTKKSSWHFDSKTSRYDTASASYIGRIQSETGLKKARTGIRCVQSVSREPIYRQLQEYGHGAEYRRDGNGSAFPPCPESSTKRFPTGTKPWIFTQFTHGSRIRRREVSLVFNAIDSVEGLTEILGVPSNYGVRATFFVNGEFIRRHPGAVKEIADSGHEVGSLFLLLLQHDGQQVQH